MVFSVINLLGLGKISDIQVLGCGFFQAGCGKGLGKGGLMPEGSRNSPGFAARRTLSAANAQVTQGETEEECP